MRVIVVLAQKPTVEGTAGGKCGFALLHGLRAHGLEPTVLSAKFGGAASSEPPSDFQLELRGIPPPRNWRERWQRVRVPRGHFARGRFMERLRELAADADILHFDEADTAAARSGLSVPAVVRMHHLTERDRAMGPPWRRAALDWLEYRASERRAARGSRWLIANSHEVGAALRQIAPRAEIVVAPLALHPDAYADRAALERPVAGLIGTADWPPTTDAIRRVVARVWPRVRAAVPEARLRIAGYRAERERFRDVPGYDAPDIEWLGTVDSAIDFIRDLGVFLYPVTRGSGTKVKVLEAMALGVPIVTTAAGAEGLIARAGVSVVEDDDALAAAAVALLRDPDGRREAGTVAREAFEAHHTPAIAAEPIVHLYRRMLS